MALGIKRTLVTVIECISAGGRSIPPLIIWPASTHRIGRGNMRLQYYIGKDDEDEEEDNTMDCD